jgi:hypothetical protein
MHDDAQWADRAICGVEWRMGRLAAGRRSRMAEDFRTIKLEKRVDLRHVGANAKLRHQCQQHGQQPVQVQPMVQHCDFVRP